MPQIINLNQIKKILKNVNPVQAIEQGFIAYSQGNVVVPPVGEMIFDNPPGDVHIKYGYIQNENYYVIKIASGFYENVKLGIPSSNGLMLVFNQKTGELLTVLLDEGYLTDIRTAAAGAVAAKYLAPKNVQRIGILGAGVQGKLQLQFLKSFVACRDVLVWGINQDELHTYKKEMESDGFQIQTTLNCVDVQKTCNLIVTATPSKTPLLFVKHLQKGTHITAIGSDTPEKQELDSRILQQANIVVADSINQSQSRGEIYQARKAGLLKENKIVELGNVIQKSELQRISENQITIADLTGVAVQDIQIAKEIVKAFK